MIRICQECLGSIHTKKCPKCTQIFETTIINWDKIPSNDNIASVINPQPYDLVDPLWVSLNKYLVIDVEENQKLLLKEKEEKINEKKKIVSSKEAKIREEAKKKEDEISEEANKKIDKIREEAKKNVDKILSEMNKSIRELEGKDNEISTEIEKIFQKNQQEIEKESKEIKQKVDNRQIDFNNIDILKRKSDDLKNKLIEKETEIRK